MLLLICLLIISRVLWALGLYLRTRQNLLVRSIIHYARSFLQKFKFHHSGDTIGGIGSAIAVKRGTFKQNFDGSFSGTLTVQPDRGFNM